jgi:lysyl-tRNA synthetase class 2
VKGDDDETIEKVSPFEGDDNGEQGKPKLPLTWENVQTVLDEVRPYLQGDGGDCKIVDIDGPVVKLELQGACSSCSSSTVTLKMGIEKTLRERIPEVDEVIAITPEEEPLSKEGVEEVLDGIRPFLSVSGGTIDMHDSSQLSPSEGEQPKLVLQMTGPPLKSMAVRVEVCNRIKRRFPKMQDIEIVGEDGQKSM